MLFNGVYGNDIANGNLLQLDNAEGIFNSVLTRAYENAWTPTNPSNTHPRIGFSTNGRPAISDRIIEGPVWFLSNLHFKISFSSFFFIATVYPWGYSTLTRVIYPIFPLCTISLASRNIGYDE